MSGQSKVCNTADLLEPEYRALYDEYCQLSADGTLYWDSNNHNFRAWEYVHTFKNLNLKGNERLYDIGSENSIFPIWLKTKFPQLDITCVDTNFTGALEARAKLHNVALTFHSKPFTTDLGLADYITCISVLEHVERDYELVATMVSCLKPGGKVIITVDYDKEDVPWPFRQINVVGSGRMYGKNQIYNRIIRIAESCGAKFKFDVSDASFEFRKLGDVPGIAPLWVPYTACCLIFEKPR